MCSFCLAKKEVCVSLSTQLAVTRRSLWLACHQMALVAACFLQALLKCFQTILLLSRLSVRILHWQFSCGKLYFWRHRTSWCLSLTQCITCNDVHRKLWRRKNVTQAKLMLLVICVVLSYIKEDKETSVEQKSCIEMRLIYKSQDALGASYVNITRKHSRVKYG